MRYLPTENRHRTRDNPIFKLLRLSFLYCYALQHGNVLDASYSMGFEIHSRDAFSRKIGETLQVMLRGFWLDIKIKVKIQILQEIF